MLGSDHFWLRMSGISDFGARLVQATTILAELIAERSADDVERIRAEAEALYDDGEGGLKMDADPPTAHDSRGSSRAVDAHLSVPAGCVVHHPSRRQRHREPGLDFAPR